MIDKMGTLALAMTWRGSGDKPLSEAMLVCCSDTYVHHSASMSWAIEYVYNLLLVGY